MERIFAGIFLTFLFVNVVDAIFADTTQEEPRIINAEITMVMAIFSFIPHMIKFALRGFGNEEIVKFFVNEQITLGGDTSYYITKNTYLGKSKRPINVEYCHSYYNKELDDFILLDPKKYEKIKEQTILYGFSPHYEDLEKFNNYSDVLNVCLQLREEHDRILNKELQQQEKEKLQEVVAINTYEI